MELPTSFTTYVLETFPKGLYKTSAVVVRGSHVRKLAIHYVISDLDSAEAKNNTNKCNDL